MQEIDVISYRLLKERSTKRAIEKKLDALDEVIKNTLEVLKQNKRLLEEKTKAIEENQKLKQLLLNNNIKYVIQ